MKAAWTTRIIEQLGFLLSAHLSLLESMRLITSFEKNPKMRAVLESITQHIHSGAPLSTALREQSAYFPSSVVLYILLGEQTGMLPELCSVCAKSRYQQAKIISAIKGACIYPALVLVSISIVLFCMFWFIVPRLTQLFSSMKASLPLITRIVLGIQLFVAEHWIILVSTSVMIVTGCWFAYRHFPGVQTKIELVLLRFPYISSVILLYASRNVCNVLAVSVAHGMTVDQALMFLRQSSRWIVYKTWFERTISLLGEGRYVSEFITQSALFADDCGHLLAVAERSGNFPEICTTACDRYDHELFERLQSLSRIIEPLLMVVIGVIVAVVVISLIAPLYSITSYVTPH